MLLLQYPHVFPRNQSKIGLNIIAISTDAVFVMHYWRESQLSFHKSTSVWFPTIQDTRHVRNDESNVITVLL